jgi:hypothetical protein
VRGRNLARALAAMLTVLAMLVSATGSEGARPRDRFWVRPDAASFPLRRIAFLPVVSDGLDAASQAVEEQWLLRFIQDGHDWVPPEICSNFMEALARQKPDSVKNAVRMQVLRTGQPDSLRVPFLAKVLHSQALLVIRVDRWDRVVEHDARLTTATVELTASLVDSAGRLLWRASGLQHQLSRYGVPQADLPISTGGGEPAGFSTVQGYMYGQPHEYFTSTPGSSAGIPNPQESNRASIRTGPDHLAALRTMLERWSASYPWKVARGSQSPAAGGAR